MQLAILGATGQTGLELVKLALQSNHNVIAVVRDPQKMKIQDDNLKVVQADVFSATSLEPQLENVDAVISCLGFARTSVVTGYSESMKSITDAMRKKNVKRLVTMTAFYTDIESAKNQGFLVNWILIPMLKPILKNMREMELQLEAECKDLQWTAVRPPGLTTGPATSVEMRIEEDKFLTTNSDAKRRVARGDIAKVMLDIAVSQKYLNKCVAVNY
ncbi:flavin reductase (NADPH)-like [Artemia franciscana]|uniref:NAD(P)-binding domain-containing protein n=1 Tax=Artemia franciscana TaxID=6661 RepID=A0AA88HYM8_ARTSF|nr:hypothetical protein QYM36_006877 [Artemia franciscana]